MKMNLAGFVEEGQPKKGFVDGITTAVVKLAIDLKIPLMMYGEQGETEYGGVRSFEPMPTKSLY